MPGTKYEARVTPVNLHGRGTPITAHPAYRIPASTPDPPPTIQIATLDFSRLLIPWPPVLCSRASGDSGCNGRAVTQYRVEWAPTSDFQMPTGDGAAKRADAGSLLMDVTNHHSTETLLSTVIGGLNAGQPVFVRVFAYNAQGWSKPSSASDLFGTPAGVPEEPSAIAVEPASATSLRVMIKPPIKDHGSAIYGYIIKTNNDYGKPDCETTIAVEHPVCPYK